jgi:hypothetical protein
VQIELVTIPLHRIDWPEPAEPVIEYRQAEGKKC